MHLIGPYIIGPEIIGPSILSAQASYRPTDIIGPKHYRPLHLIGT